MVKYKLQIQNMYLRNILKYLPRTAGVRVRYQDSDIQFLNTNSQLIFTCNHYYLYIRDNELYEYEYSTNGYWLYPL